MNAEDRKTPEVDHVTYGTLDLFTILSILYHICIVYCSFGPSCRWVRTRRANSCACIPQEVMEELAGCTIHPSVLDCTLQSCLIITLDESKGQELLPKAISRLVVHRPMETTMFVHTTLRFRASRQHVFDLKLLSTSGHVIAELEGLVCDVMGHFRGYVGGEDYLRVSSRETLGT